MSSLAMAMSMAGLAGAQGISVYVNGDPVRFASAGPRQINGRVMVPLRGVMEKMGAYVSYQGATKTVIASKGDVDMQLRIGESFAIVNGRRTSLDVPAMVYAGTTMVPLRFMSEALGAQVQWDAPSMAVRILTAGTAEPTTPDPDATTNSGALTIRSFDMDKTGYLRAGDRVVYTLQGNPGGEATMQIPGVTDTIPMAEVQPGRYQAIVVVPNNAMTLSKATAVARLRLGSQETVLQSSRNLMVDSQPPVLREPFPEADSRIARVQPNITVAFEDLDGSGVDPETVRVMLDRKDVTRDATITGSTIFYRPGTALASGEHTVRVSARDRAGNAAQKEWSFIIGKNRNVAETISHNGAKRLRPGQVVKFTVRGEPGSRVTYSMGDKIMNLPMQEVSEGVYEAQYTVRLEDDLAGTPVTARIRTKDNEVYTVQANQLLGEAGPPMRPTITSPDPNATTRSVSGNTVNIRGKAGRRAKVKVTIDYSSTILGIFKQNGTIAERTIFADENGNWETGDIRIDSSTTGPGTVYTVSAVAVGKNNVTSEITKTTFTR
jgi:hypothetical protein